MKFVISSDMVLPCVAICAATTDKKDDKFSLVRIEALKSSVNFCSASLASGTLANAKATVADTGVAGVDCNNLLRVLRQCDGDISFDLANNNLKIKCGEQRYSLLVSSDADKIPFRKQDRFSDYVVPLPEAKAIMLLCAPAADIIRANDVRGITIEATGTKIRFSAMAKNGAAGATGYIKHKSEKLPPILVSMDFCNAILAMPVADEKAKLEIGTNGNVVTYRHAWGYSYFSLLTGKPLDVEMIFGKIAEMMKSNEKKSALVLAGILATSLKKVLVMADKEDGNKGKLSGGKKGRMTVYCHTESSGAAQNTIITAGDFLGESWYNLRYLSDYVQRIPADEEIRITPVGDPGSEHLIISHGQNLYALTSCGAPDGNDDEE